MAVPAVVEYKYWEARCEKLPKSMPFLFPPVPVEEEDRRYEELHRKYAPQLLDVYMKVREREFEKRSDDLRRHVCGTSTYETSLLPSATKRCEFHGDSLRSSLIPF